MVTTARLTQTLVIAVLSGQMAQLLIYIRDTKQQDKVHATFRYYNSLVGSTSN